MFDQLGASVAAGDVYVIAWTLDQSMLYLRDETHTYVFSMEMMQDALVKIVGTDFEVIDV